MLGQNQSARPSILHSCNDALDMWFSLRGSCSAGTVIEDKMTYLTSLPSRKHSVQGQQMLLGTDVIVGGIRIEHPAAAETAESFRHVGGRKSQQRLEV